MPIGRIARGIGRLFRGPGNKGVEGIGEAQQQAEESRGGFSDIVNNMLNMARQTQEAPRMTAEDLFGPQMQRLNDAIRSSTNATRQALSRGLLSGGGDPSGASAAGFLGAGQTEARQLGDTSTRFATLADQINRREQSRGDQLLTQAAQGMQNLLRLDTGRRDQLEERDIMQDQARSQRIVDVVGGLLQAGGTAAAAFCWMAIELYGKDSDQYKTIRPFLLKQREDSGVLSDFVDAYEELGEEWASQAAEDPSVRIQAEILFDQLYEIAKAA